MITAEHHPSIIPTLRYKDAPAAIDWLCDAFGFERHLVVSGDGDTIAHAQLVYRRGMIMLGSDRQDDYSNTQRTASDLGGVSQSPYVVVSDADAHYKRAVAGGAHIVTEPMNPEYGGRFYSCLDLEGNLWHFGTYDPWEDRAATQ